jgi:hypothetical protein
LPERRAVGAAAALLGAVGYTNVVDMRGGLAANVTAWGVSTPAGQAGLPRQ